MFDDEPELCDAEDWYDEGVDNGKIKAYCDAAEIIRSHMDEVTNMSGKRLIDANALDDEVMNFFLLLQEIRSRQQSSENVRNHSEE